MKKISVLLTFLILVGIFIPAVSAGTIIDETLSETRYTGGDYTYDTKGLTAPDGTWDVNVIRLKNAQDYTDINYIGLTITEFSQASNFLAEGTYETTYTYNGVTKPCNIYVEHDKNFLGQLLRYRFLIFPQNWDNGGLTGLQTITLGTPLYRQGMSPYSSATQDAYIASSNRLSVPIPGKYKLIIASTYTSKNNLIVSMPTNNDYEVKLLRQVDGVSYSSRIDLKKGASILLYNEESSNFYHIINKNAIDTILVTMGSNTYQYDLNNLQTDPDINDSVTIYVKNSQTYALIADSHIDISASVNGNLHEVVNETVPSGIYSIDLQPTGGGMPNPDFYRLIVTAEGYNSIMPYMDFEVKGATRIYEFMEPIGGAPEDENNTFIDFYVRDMSANPISGATVNFGGYTLITNSAGYTIFEVDKSKTYSWTVSKSGYGSLTGNAVIGGNARHTINTVLAPAVTPTTPTAIPTSTPISPTPTMTAPTGEPVSNWLEWFAAHFGMILGGGAEIGKIFMWLCFSVPVGVYVGKESKAGAAGFMAGAGVVTLFFVLIGWVPIWLLVFLALIIGLLYAKAFNNSDTGGGR